MRKKAGPGAHVAALLFAAFLLSGAAAAQPAGAQQAAGSVAGVQENPKILPRVLVLFFRVPDQGFPPTVRFLAYESLVQELRSSMPDVVILEPARAGGDLADAQFPAPPPTPIERDRAARDMGGDSYLYVEMSGNVPQIDVRYEFADLLAAERSTSGSFHKVLDARFRNLNTVFWYSIAESIRDRLKSREQVVAVTFRGPAGTRVEQESGAKRQITLTAEAGSGQSQDAAQSPEGGRSPAAGQPAGSGRIRSATVQLPAPGAYRFRASLPGYYPAEAGVTVDQDPVTVPLSLHRKSSFMFDFTLTDLSFPALSAAYQILPESLYARVTFETYLLGIIPLGSTGSDYDRNGNNRPFFVSLGSSQLLLSVGTYLFPQHGFWGVFRPYINAGAFVRLVSMPGYWGIDPQIPWGAEVDVGFELLPESPLRGIIAFSPRLYRAPDTALAASGLFDTGQFWRFKLLDGYILQIPTMYFGVRYQP